MKKVLSFFVVALLVGCVTRGGQWVAAASKDEFTDVVTKYVTVGEDSMIGSSFTVSNHFYPFIGIENGSLAVGIRSGGKIRVPPGTVQIRVDDNEAWTINTSESPLRRNTKDGERPTDIASQVSSNIARATAPYTAATGEKARAIARQMLAGKVIKFRTLGIGGNGSTTGQATVDASLPAALREIGIDPKSF